MKEAQYENLNAEKNQSRIPYLKILPTSGNIGNKRNLKFVLQAEPEVVYTTTVRDIILRDTDVPPNNPAIIARWGQYEANHCCSKYWVR